MWAVGKFSFAGKRMIGHKKWMVPLGPVKLDLIGLSQSDAGLHGYLLDVRDVQRSVDQPFVHGMFSVFAFLVQVHCLQRSRRITI